MGKTDCLPIAVTMGEPAGIGGDVMLKAWTQQKCPAFFVIDDPRRLASLARRLGLDVPLREIHEPFESVDIFHQALPVLAQPVEVSVVAGHPDPANARPVIDSIRRAVTLVQAEKASSLVTLPISKHVLHQGGFAHPGHTEFLAELAGPRHDGPPWQPVMMLACKELKVIPVTVHMSLKDAVAALRREAIIHAGMVVAHSLRDFFALPSPRLSVAALNPHAGEGGTMGREEIDIIAPAVNALNNSGVEAFGPAPADTLFHGEARETYDACLCMYHDQALIPIKTLDFYQGVNVTLGLPFIRTSPDHGTAFSLAGTGTAREESFVAALRLAAEMATRHQRTMPRTAARERQPAP